MSVMNFFDQTRAGQYTDEAQEIKRLDRSPKMKLYAGNNNFVAPIGRTGHFRDTRTVIYIPREAEKTVAKVADFGQIRLKGRR